MADRHEGPGRLRTHADRPISQVEEDRFGFLAYADALALLVNDAGTDTPLTIGISGRWGSGKTSLAKLLENRLYVEQYWLLDWEGPPLTCWFNAWLHRDAEHLGAAFAASVARDLDRARSLWRRWLSPLPVALVSHRRRVMRRVSTGITISILALAAVLTALAMIPDLRAANALLGNLVEDRNIVALAAAVPVLVTLVRGAAATADRVGAFVTAPNSEAANGTLNDVRSQLGGLLRHAQRQRKPSGNSHRRIVIFIDDLERCPASKALEICEVANHLFGQKDVIIIFVADFDILEEAATKYYGLATGTMADSRSEGREYLHKMIQLRFDLPPLAGHDVASALGLAGPWVAAKDTENGLHARLRTLPKELLLDWSPTAWFLETVVRYSQAIFPFISLGASLIVLVIFGQYYPRIDDVVPFEPWVQTLAFGTIIILGAWILTRAAKALLGFLSTRQRQVLQRRLMRVRNNLEMQLELRNPGRLGRPLRREYDLGLWNDEDLRVTEYRILWERAEKVFAKHVPRNPRRAKRLINHQRLLATIAASRDIFGGDQSITHRHLAKWVLIVEHWPHIGGSLVQDSSEMAALEGARNAEDLRKALGPLAPDSRDLDELVDVLQAEPPLAPVLERLVRFEPANRPSPRQYESRIKRYALPGES